MRRLATLIITLSLVVPLSGGAVASGQYSPGADLTPGQSVVDAGTYDARASHGGTIAENTTTNKTLDVTVRAMSGDVNRVTSLSRLRNASEIGGTIAENSHIIFQYQSEKLLDAGMFRDPPGKSLIYTETNENRTAHSLSIPGTANATEFRNITIDYSPNGSAAPSNLSNATIDEFGFDLTGNGQIDYSMKDEVANSTVIGQEKLKFSLETEYKADETDRVLVKYAGINNPTNPEANNVTVELGNSTTVGEINYGRSGEFGNGIDIDISSPDFVTPMPFEYTIDNESDSLYLIFNSESVSANSTINITTTIGDEGTQNSLRSKDSVEIAPVQGSLSLIGNPENVQAGTQVSVAINTNLAPGTKVSVWAKVESGMHASIALRNIVIPTERVFQQQVSIPKLYNEGHSISDSDSIGFFLVNGRDIIDKEYLTENNSTEIPVSN